MILVMLHPYSIRSEALHECIDVTLMLPAPEYPMPITLKNCRTPFLSSMLLILVLASIPFSFSSLVMGGFTRMMRHLGSAMGSSGAPAFTGFWVDLVFIEVGCFGLAGLAATAAHDLVDSFIGVAIVVGSWLIACVSCASFVSKTLILFVRYTFISAIYAMVISFSFPVSVFSFKAEILLYHAAYS